MTTGADRFPRAPPGQHAIFNASSNGAILLDNELIEGDFRKRAFYKVGGSIESRDVNSTEK